MFYIIHTQQLVLKFKIFFNKNKNESFVSHFFDRIKLILYKEKK